MLFFKDCGVKGEYWHGSILSNQQRSNVASACDCSNHCNSNPKCEFWDYDETGQTCSLRKNFKRIEMKVDHTAGFRNNSKFPGIFLKNRFS